MIAKQEQLFPELNKARYGERRQHNNLFIPRYLQKGSADYRLRDQEQRDAFEIIKKWAALESSGKLEKMTETTLQGEFLTDVFGTALGYTLFSDNKEKWNLQAQYSVNGGMADAAIGTFEADSKRPPVALVELKGPKTNVDRDRYNGRTPVQQCWDYLNAVPECPWGIVCNYVSFRLYNRNKTPRAYQLFVLQDLVEEKAFRQFYFLFEKEGLVSLVAGQRSRAEALLEESGEQQQKVGNELYEAYHSNRVKLISHLQKEPHDKQLEQAIHISQKLLDRIVFVAFCEDRGLLPEKSIHKAYSQIPAFARVTNPRWQNFLNLFGSIDKGNEKHGISPYNGGLFRSDPEVDDLELDDHWTDFFATLGKYDFRDEVNVDVLGHLFEKSIGDVGRIRLSGLFDAAVDDEKLPKMAKSAERKRSGIYYTPPDFTNFISRHVILPLVEQAIEGVAKRHGVDPNENGDPSPSPKRALFFRDCFEALKSLKIVDPACGSGAFLISAYEQLEEWYHEMLDDLPPIKRTR